MFHCFIKTIYLSLKMNSEISFYFILVYSKIYVYFKEAEQKKNYKNIPPSLCVC